MAPRRVSPCSSVRLSERQNNNDDNDRITIRRRVRQEKGGNSGNDVQLHERSVYAKFQHNRSSYFGVIGKGAICTPFTWHASCAKLGTAAFWLFSYTELEGMVSFSKKKTVRHLDDLFQRDSLWPTERS